MRGLSRFAGDFHAVFAIMAVVVLAGCSDRSRMNLRITGITGTEGNRYIQADMMGQVGTTNPCTGLAFDLAEVGVVLEKPGSLGPTFDAFICAWELDFYYYDPVDGMLKGPVPQLAVRDNNAYFPLMAGSETSITLPIVAKTVKMWSVGVTCPVMGLLTAYNQPGFRVNRMIARVTLRAEDMTGKRDDDYADVLVYLLDFATGPDMPTGTPTQKNYCYGMDLVTYWNGRCY